ncbi:nitrate- and nitrite sensing domain-containing protein [Planomonospora corallina]|uniref:histidine kinase n=1 Tax=Planomonospora corallina TaxID=1806052 RepID=A0ABV8I6K2_9ACTN
MDNPGRPIRFRITALLLVPIVSLVALWGFAASLTAGDGMRLLEITTLVDGVATPSERAVIELQNERLHSVRYLNGRSDQDTLVRQRLESDQSLAAFRRLARSESVRETISADMQIRLTTLFSELDQLPAARALVDSRSADTVRVIRSYNRIIDLTFEMYDRMILVPESSIYQQARSVTALGQMKEILARERALLSAAGSGGSLSEAEHAEFTEMVATRRLVYRQAMAKLDAELRAPYDKLGGSAHYRHFLDLETEVLASRALPVDLSPVEQVWVAVERGQVQVVDLLVARVTPAAIGIFVQIAVAGGLGLILLVVSVVLAFRFSKRLAAELGELRDVAIQLAEVRLPQLVERLRKGQDVPEEPLPRLEGTPEIRDIGRALDTVRHTAYEAAADQSRLRRGVSQVFVSLARRNQSLLHRQLTQLESMQRQEEQPETLADLYRLDHLTTRMRRHAENLIILSGAAPGRGWRRPVPVVDVLRAAVAEVEDYARVRVLPAPQVSLAGSAVADVIHLIAELVENATVFSPPQTRVVVRAEPTATGLAVEVEDRGLGIPDAELAGLNRRLAEHPEFDLADSDRLGLFVVAVLASRHGVQVTLRHSPYGGISAIALIPAAVLAEEAPALP